ncbi:MAG: caspase family protein, partial [Gemmatimonadaceae bacterium]
MPSMSLVRALIVVINLVLATSGEAQTRSTRQPAVFSLGDTREQVRMAQGAPAVIERLTSLGAEIWSWRSASVRFSASTGRVIAWSDPDHELRAQALGGGLAAGNRLIGIGSSASDALRLLGQPLSVTTYPSGERWIYRGGRAVVAVDSARRTVIGWVDPDRRLPVVDPDRTEAERALTGRSSNKTSEASSSERGAPRLQMTLTIRDTAAGARMAGARNALLLTIANRGSGTAYSVEPYTLISPLDGASATVGWGDAISSIPPGATVTRETPIRLPSSLPSTRLLLLAGAREQNGFGVSPELRVELTVTPSNAPRLAAVAIEQEDQSGDGRVSPREVVDVVVRLANVGSGELTGASAVLSLGRDVFAAAGTPGRLELPRVRPGDSVDVRFSVSTNARAESIAVRVVVRDASLREMIRLDVPLRMTGRPAQGSASGVTLGIFPAKDGTDVDAPFATHATVNPDAVAVIFGVDYYRSLPRARFAARDATTMSRYVTDVFGVPNDADHILLRQDGDATQGEFRRAFGETGWLARRVKPQSDVIVYFAGHGAADRSGAPLLLPFDADVNYPRETAVQLADLYGALAKLPARRIIVVIDACFSGISRGGVALAEGARPIVVSIEHPALLRNGMVVFAAAQGAQTANDLPEKQHGLFSYQLFRALRGSADTDGDGSMTVDEIDAFVTRETRAAAARKDREQIPLVIARERSLVVVRVPSGS